MMEHSRYKIIERLDSGGMAEVFRAVEESTVGGMKRNVAIKRILPNLTRNKKFVAMFLDEARLSLHLQHANIVQVTDIGKVDSHDGSGEEAYFLVMEYVEGVNLKTLLEYQKRLGQKLPISSALYLIIEICKALAYAHELSDPETGALLGIVHRDVSPPNILISRRGEVKLVDFGLAKATSQIESTDPGIVKGKFNYLSPEAALGELVDHRSDIFAVGVLLYEMLTGQRLFNGQTDYQTIELVRKAHIPSIRQQNPVVDQTLENIIRKILAKDAYDRYQSAADVGEILTQYLFTNNLKVTSRDLENLVARCMTEKPTASGQSGFLIDTLVQDEILRFISLEDLDIPNEEPPPIPGPPETLIDPRLWNIEIEPLYSRTEKSAPAREAVIAKSAPPTASSNWWMLIVAIVLVLGLIGTIWVLLYFSK